MNYQYIYGRLSRLIDNHDAVMELCQSAKEQAAASGRFILEVPGGFLFGRLDRQHGLIFG